MNSVAIILANATYTKQSPLPCCLEDMRAMHTLVEATGRYSTVIDASDLDADGMRDTIRSALTEGEAHDEVFFYFSGHGYQGVDGTFYFCGTTFDNARPNATGLSQEDLQQLVRAADPQLFVQVVDACSSGQPLVKSEQRLLPPTKDGLHDIVFLASCKDNQSAFGGDPLSKFTTALIEAVVQKADGPIYYTDVINMLRDEFIDDPVQTPFHIFQGTGHAVLVDDAKKLQGFRDLYEKEWRTSDCDLDQDDSETIGTDIVTTSEMSLVERLRITEERMPTEESIKSLVDSLFDGVAERFQIGEFSELFDVNTEFDSGFSEPTAREFIIQVMSRQQRSDRFVTAEIRRVQKKPTALQRAMDAFGTTMMGMYPEYENLFELELNCRMERAQMKLTLVPKFTSLQQLVLVLTCAPSLERCYVFEVTSRHARTSLAEFDYQGSQLYRHWYKVNWDDDVDWLVEEVSSDLEDAVRNYVTGLDQRLSED